MPTSRTALLEWPEELPVLPPEVVTKDRQCLRTAGDRWFLRANVDGGGEVIIDFRPLYEVCTDRFVHIAQRYVVKKARTSAALTLRNIAQSLRRATRFWSRKLPLPQQVDWSMLDEGDFQALLTHGLQSPTGVAGNDFAAVRALYAWGCHVARLRDFSPELTLQLKAISAPGNLKGRKVLNMDPEDGPFTTDEVELIDDAINEWKGGLNSAVIVQLFQELGIRPIQALRTRWSGLKCYEVNIVENGVPRTLCRYTLDIPRAKERGEERVEETRPISTRLGTRLRAHKPVQMTNETPLFWWLGEMASTLDVDAIVQAWIDHCGLISPRTMKALKGNPTRFRYTLATEAARDGASKMHVAYLLFQKDPQNVEVYFDAAGTVMEQIETLLEKTFGDHINRFLGKISSSAEPVPHPGLKRRVVPPSFPQLPDMPLLKLGLGACGQNVDTEGLCRLAPPITCYRCPKFAAFRDADHQAVLAALENFALTRFGGLADPRVAGELILTIVAIRQLIEQIAEEKLNENDR